ncbi:amino acid adenylation domain-containing protein [Trichocoleus sp. FACHB-591]|uniref:non-ribosomal peptide synthetase n=1 Tax=Trichocoleus sp. FACHB-591 TaxID=2692872 RepID=UPI001685E54F|nr:non-ribosomal peptide synthetase [Trichocoleus sp. FACHB-591]MBD2095650.1 amino acid adenylation domain-containing protein [Trichocoleus sp. FACHB-591]
MQTPTLEGFQLSPQQQRCQLLQDQRSTNWATCLVRIKGNLQFQVLEAAIQQVAQQHEILRTAIAVLPGTDLPLQVITDHLPTLESWDGQAMGFEPGALTTDCSPLTVRLTQLATDQHLLQLILPIWCTDAIALTHLVDQISQAYAAIAQGEEYVVDPVQYADLAAWQCELLETEEAATGRAYWRQQPWMPLERLQLPFQQRSPEKLGFQPQQLTLTISNEQTQALTAIAQAHQFSLSTLLLTAWQVLLWRHTDQSILIVGVTDAGRQYEELEAALGLLAKVLPIASELEATLPFATLLQQLHTSLQTAAQWQEAFTWKDVPELAIAHHPPFLPFGFEWLDQSPSFASDNLNWTIQQRQIHIESFQLKLVGQQREELNLELHYNAQAFEAGAVQQLAGRLTVLLKNLICDPQTAIGKLEILTESDRQQLLALNPTAVEYPQLCIHELFETQAKRSPGQVAVVFEDESLTYQQLNDKANQLAYELQQRGVELETPVAIYLERSLEMIISLLAILKAGGAYVPLDPSLPPAALAARLQEAEIPVLITQSSLLDKLTPDVTSTLICLDHEMTSACEFDSVSPQHIALAGISERGARGAKTAVITPANLAYILFTSGSTGKPKGVAVEHRQLSNYLYGVQRSLKLDELPPSANFALVSTFAADLGNTMIFASLCFGGCLHILSSERVMNPAALAEYSDRYPIDCLKIVPSHLRALLTSPDAHRFLPRQRLILGGEALSGALVEQVRQQVPNCQIFNHYGPTETTVGVLTYTVLETLSESETVPLGTPIANTQIYLLNECQQPVPMGVPGEIYIGGANVARGYWQQAELTEKRFISNPLKLQNASYASLLYKTGDLARYLPDGTIAFLGRADDQVKIRGFRIELGEVESVLRQHPDVRSLAVIKREDQPNQPQLVAYMVRQTPDTPGLTESLRSFLAARLPEYMVPSAFVSLKSIPLTANGKVDRQALPAPKAQSLIAKPAFAAPRNEIERQLTATWASVLGVAEVGIHDNFFELGGDSILSIQAIAKANQVGLRFTPRQLFEHQTIAQLALVVETQPQGDFAAPQALITGEVPLIPIQHRFFEQNLAEPHHWNQAVFLEAQLPLQAEILQQAIQHLMNHHDALRLRFQRVEDTWQQMNSGFEKEIPFTVMDLSNQVESQQEAIAQAVHWAQTSLNLETGPLLRVVLFQRGAQQSDQLLIVIHHLAVDGLSWRVLLEDLQTAYHQLEQGQSVQLPPKTASFQQWAKQLQTYVQSEACQKTVDYWLQTLNAPVAALPGDRTGENAIASAQTLSVSLNVDETQTLLQTMPKAYRAQMDEVLLTALAHSLATWTGKTDFLIDLEGHGREVLSQVDVSRTVGWFTAIYPARLAVDAQAEVSDVLKSVKEQLRQIPQSGVDYGIFRYLSSDELVRTNLQNAPQAEILFNYLGQFDATLAASSLFRMATTDTGATRSPQAQRQYLLEVNALVLEGRLQLDWIYNPKIHALPVIERLTQQFLTSLRSLLHPDAAPVSNFTPSDFPQANVSQVDLDKLFARMSQTRGGAQ